MTEPSYRRVPRPVAVVAIEHHPDEAKETLAAVPKCFRGLRLLAVGAVPRGQVALNFESPRGNGETERWREFWKLPDLKGEFKGDED
jgi:hypothetical protein